MATVAEAPIRAQTCGLILPDQRITLYGVDWPTYQRLSEIIGDRQIRVAINRGVLELMSPGAIHEDYKNLLGRMVESITEELGIPCKSRGSTTWDRPESERGVEADECYLLTPEKVADFARRRPTTAADSPVPDLVIEIDIRASAVDRAEIYANLGVPEVWRFDGETLRIDRLGPEGTYAPAAESLFLPITPAEVAHWVLHVDSADETAWARAFRAWARAELVPRRQPPRLRGADPAG